jgi:hypothetical protein
MWTRETGVDLSVKRTSATSALWTSYNVGTRKGQQMGQIFFHNSEWQWCMTCLIVKWMLQKFTRLKPLEQPIPIRAANQGTGTPAIRGHRLCLQEKALRLNQTLVGEYATHTWELQHGASKELTSMHPKKCASFEHLSIEKLLMSHLLAMFHLSILNYYSHNWCFVFVFECVCVCLSVYLQSFLGFNSFMLAVYKEFFIVAEVILCLIWCYHFRWELTGPIEQPVLLVNLPSLPLLCEQSHSQQWSNW